MFATALTRGRRKRRCLRMKKRNKHVTSYSHRLALRRIYKSYAKAWRGLEMPQTIEKVSIIPQNEPTAIVPVTPMDMIQRAVASGADIVMIEKLMSLQERWETGQARKACDEYVD